MKHGITRSSIILSKKVTPAEIATALQQYGQRMNTNLSAIQERLERLERDNDRLKARRLGEPISLTAVQQFAVAGRQGLFHLTWQKAVGTVDGYTILMATDSVMSSLVGRFEVRNREMCQYQIPIGNGAFTRYFRIFSFFGNVSSAPSAIVSATSVAYGAAEGAPADPPVAPDPPEETPPGGHAFEIL